MTEDTRTQALITDEDVEAFGKARYGPDAWPHFSQAITNSRRHEIREELEEVAPGLRARWVAEALEELVSPAYLSRAGMAPPVDEIRRVAAEYRDGRR